MGWSISSRPESKRIQLQSSIPHSLSTLIQSDQSVKEERGEDGEYFIRESLEPLHQRIDTIRDGANAAKRRQRSSSAPNRILDDFNKEARHYRWKHHGRPLHEILHTHCRKSLLSNDTGQLDLKGFVNLIFVILVVINFRMVIYNFRKYGTF
ncbi:hypothetical protein BdWA1_000225 [Babesia duncani]|uniref:Uncharacterized protein n=1 Tax=Babesia duncani TaxID=323732 RepID=A0AAD9PME0_9APIC|nr:hypothetical protein BdWA1_000225 [Babesia duncani]